MPRGDLSATIYRTIENRIEVVFDNSISGIEETEGGLHVAFEHGPARDFDIVVGADGLHSRVRQLTFGPETAYEKQLGYRVASFEVEGYRPRDELAYVAHASPGRQLARIALRDDRTLFLFLFRADVTPTPDPGDAGERRALLREVFGDAGWESRQMLAAMDGVDDLYFDRVSQIIMPAWSRGRVILIGDAAAAVSLLAGEGTGLAMTEGYVLAGELDRAKGDYRAAFANHERRLRPFVEGKQKSAVKFASSFLPKTAAGIWLRNQATKVMRAPKIADFVIGKSINVADDFDLPDYGMARDASGDAARQDEPASKVGRKTA